jgi:hypothetical protein
VPWGDPGDRVIFLDYSGNRVWYWVFSLVIGCGSCIFLVIGWVPGNVSGHISVGATTVSGVARVRGILLIYGQEPRLFSSGFLPRGSYLVVYGGINRKIFFSRVSLPFLREKNFF